jgi:hypothetical protein
MAIRVDFNTGTTAAPVWSDITSFVRSVSVSRGKDELLDGFSAGSASIVLDNLDRRFDPLYSSSPYAGAIVPRRAVRVFADYGTSGTVTRTNLALNPSTEYPVITVEPDRAYIGTATAWSSNIGPDTVLRYGLPASSLPFGSVAILFEPTAISTNFAATAGTYYTASAYHSTGGVDSRGLLTVQLILTWLDSGGSPIGPPFTQSAAPSTDWTQIFVTAQAPTGAVAGRVEFSRTRDSSTVTPAYYLLDAVLVEEGRTLNAYFDGDRGLAGPTAVYSWNGTAGSATSTATFTQETGFVFAGYIDDWDLSYEIGGNNTATIKASDGFSLLANQTIENQTMPVELTGGRISRLINSEQIAWPINARNIEVGVKFVGEDVADNANALSYLQEVELSELGQLFVAKDGDLTFLDATRNNPNPDDSVATFADDGSGIPFTALQVVYGSEQLANVLEVDWPGGSEIGTNQESIDAYGVTSLSADTLNQNADDAAYLANYYTTRFGQPQYRIDSILVNVFSLSSANQTAVQGLELGDVVTVKFTPKVGPQIVQYAKVVRINSTIVDGAKRYEVEFGLETFQSFPMILNDAEYGKLDDDYVLGF